MDAIEEILNSSRSTDKEDQFHHPHELKRWRPIHLKEHLPFKYAVILATSLPSECASPVSSSRSVVEMQVEVIKNLCNAGLDVTILNPTKDTEDRVVLLLNIQKLRLVQEMQTLVADRQGYSNLSEIRQWDAIVEATANGLQPQTDDYSNELLTDRPAWHRSSGKGTLPATAYDAGKWESERLCSYADELLCIKRVVHGKIEEESWLFRGAGIDCDLLPKRRRFPIVLDAFPLHDDKFVHDLFTEMNPASNQHSSKFINHETWLVEELRYHFGERVAFYFSFQSHYTHHLRSVAIVGFVLWLIFRLIFASPVAYFRMLALYGFVIAVVWGPVVLALWRQRCHQHNHAWKLINWQDDLDPNPEFDWGRNGKENSMLVEHKVDEDAVKQTMLKYVEEGSTAVDFQAFSTMCRELPGLEPYDSPEKQKQKFDELDTNSTGAVDLQEIVDWAKSDPTLNFPLGRRPYNPPYRYWLRQPLVWLELFLLSLVLCIFILLFLYWYVSAMLIPVCEENDSRSWPHCFGSTSATIGTGRWLYVFLQGLALGIFLDTLLESFVKWIVDRHSRENNFLTLKQQEDYYTGHLFGYLYLGWFLWYALLGFVYIPFGFWIQAAQKLFLGEDWVNDWVPDAISMDSAMITPLIVTQAINLFLDTVVPHIHRQLFQPKFLDQGPLDLGIPVTEVETQFLLSDPSYESAAAHTPTGDEPLINSAHAPHHVKLVQVLADTKDTKSIHVVQSVATWQSDQQRQIVRAWKSSTHIVEEGQRNKFNFFSEMLDPAIQFSYVVNFSAVWPLTALFAFINNFFEIMGDAYVLTTLCRRPEPRKVNGLGTWDTCLRFACAGGVFFTVGMITVATSGLEALVAPNQCGLTDSDFRMTPAIGCLGANRVATVLIMEHIGLLLALFSYSVVSHRSPEVAAAKTRTTMVVKLQFEKIWHSRAKDRAWPQP
eukprot:c2106_g1_i1.p1 GENE.c2106_g1_i1~~c2106_g1_i1.p1  ORF type:complete len:965 (-),score=158.68 c2106_g1_i1:214-3039(-)